MRCNSLYGTILPWIGRIRSTSMFKRRTLALEVDRLRIGNFGRLRSRRTGSKDIGFDKNFFFSQISHDDAIVVRIAVDLIELHCARAVRQEPCCHPWVETPVSFSISRDGQALKVHEFAAARSK